jgi:hypothetical protein
MRHANMAANDGRHGTLNDSLCGSTQVPAPSLFDAAQQLVVGLTAQDGGIEPVEAEVRAAGHFHQSLNEDLFLALGIPEDVLLTTLNQR